MNTSPRVPSLERRIIGPHLLAGAFGALCLAVLPLLGRGPHAVFIGLLAVAMLMFVVITVSRRLGKTVCSSSAIEKQLTLLAQNPSDEPVRLAQLPAADVTATGWNRLVDRSETWQTLSDLEVRLESILDGDHQKRADVVLDNLAESIAVTDGGGRITLANRAMATMLCADSTAAMQEISLVEFLLPFCTDSAQQESLLTVSRPVSMELTDPRAEPPRQLRLTRRILVQDDNQSTNLLWTLRDITQQKLAMEMSQKFVSTATHELRTPLANITAYAETLSLAEGIDIEQQKQFLNTIQSESSRLARFVDDLLHVSRMQAGALALERHETDLARLIEETCQKVRPQMNQKHIDFRVVVPPKLPSMVVDKDKLVAALVNLLGNAAKYTPENGQVRFHIDHESGTVSFVVEDTGIGIDEEELPHVFDQFFRSADERVRSINGSGLGLAFTSEVARLHGGEITVQSELDKGTTFTMTLPIDAV